MSGSEVLNMKYQYALNALAGKSYPSNHQAVLAFVGVEVDYHDDIFKLQSYGFEEAFKVALDLMEDVHSAIVKQDLKPVFVFVEDADGQRFKKNYSELVQYEDCFSVEFGFDDITEFLIRVIESKPEFWQSRLAEVVRGGPYRREQAYQNILRMKSSSNGFPGIESSSSESFSEKHRIETGIKNLDSVKSRKRSSNAGKYRRLAYIIIAYVASCLAENKMSSADILEFAESLGFANDDADGKLPALSTVENRYKYWKNRKITPAHKKEVIRLIDEEDIPHDLNKKLQGYSVSAEMVREEVLNWEDVKNQ